MNREQQRRMEELVANQHEGDKATLDSTIEDAEHHLCDGTGRSCVDLMALLLAAEAKIEQLSAELDTTLNIVDARAPRHRFVEQCKCRMHSVCAKCLGLLDGRK